MASSRCLARTSGFSFRRFSISCRHRIALQTDSKVSISVPPLRRVLAPPISSWIWMPSYTGGTALLCELTLVHSQCGSSLILNRLLKHGMCAMHGSDVAAQIWRWSTLHSTLRTEIAVLSAIWGLR